MDRFFQEGIVVRNQAVMQSGVNNKPEDMILLTKKLSYMHVQPYYVYMHDMIQGCEHLRTSLNEGIQLEKEVRGVTAGFNTPTFVCDLPEGGGKRHVASFEYYDKDLGVSVWTAPNVKKGMVFTYFDPLHALPKEAQERWKREGEAKNIIAEVLKKSEV